ncbi:MAG: hypothetical protein GXP48_07980 [Acidobacteria bacterium]|nr:hypothetical protein [Acidobacteriota bacterium]
MNPSDAPIALVDPLTLQGRQVLQLVKRFPEIARRLTAFNTVEEGEHQVTDVGGEAMLVPPLEPGEALDSCSAFLLASDRWTPRLHSLMDHLLDHPDAIFVDLSYLEELWHLGTPAAEPQQARHVRRLRVVHPAMVAAVHTVRPLIDLGLRSLNVMAMDPVSAFGREAIGRLAQQASARLQGNRAKHDIGGETLAFSSVAVPAGEMQEDAATLLPGVSVTVNRLLTGWFHGHMTNLAMTFDVPVAEGDIIARWKANPKLRASRNPLRLDTVVDQETILVAIPSFAADHRSLAVTTMADGLLIGGALTALELLGSLI